MKLLKMRQICKSFFGVRVLNKVDFTCYKGEVHALLGENGAGKSTLMNILAGVYTKDDGTIEFDGQNLEHSSISSAEKAGIAFVHQELNLFNDLKVYENIFLHKEIVNSLGYLNKKEMIKKSNELFEALGVHISPTINVEELETSKKQLLEIAKALFVNAKLIILDEPTTALSNDEIKHLFQIIERLKANGTSFIFISHKMGEIFEIADRYTILRNGELIQSGLIKDTTPIDVTKLMVGNSYNDDEIFEPRILKEPVLNINNLCGNGFHKVNLEIKRGEIVGFTGLIGSGISELFETIFGNSEIIDGSIQIEDKLVTKSSIHQSMVDKVAMIPANRKENSIIPDFNLLENMMISQHALTNKHQVIHKRKEIAKFENLKEVLNIKATSYRQLITSLSGGNQQKVIIARWLNTDADIIIMDNPTQGIDVGAKAEIYRLILQLAKEGKTILVNTLEIPEIQKIADRCVVFYHGQIHTILPREEITEEKVMLYATNAINA